jgi:hypothetical protein
VFPSLPEGYSRRLKQYQIADWSLFPTSHQKEASMSALGQKQTLKRLRLMSALPPKADIGTQSWNVRFVPEADIIPFTA